MKKHKNLWAMILFCMALAAVRADGSGPAIKTIGMLICLIVFAVYFENHVTAIKDSDFIDDEE